MKYIIEGGKKLSGEVPISGNKNSIFPCVAAALLTDEQVILDNIPNLRDTQVLIEILGTLGVEVKREESKLLIHASEISHITLSQHLMTKLRGSIVLVGSLLGRMNKVNFFHPGGDIIGRRSIDTHLEGFKKLGAVLKREDDKFRLSFSAEEKKDCDIFLPEASVTATENLVLASVLGERKVILRNCAREPHVVDLCNMLLQMGAQIEGVGTDTLIITAVKKLKGTEFRIGIDFIEVGTYAVAAAITKGEVTLTGLDKTDLHPILIPFKEFGIQFEEVEKGLKVHADKLKSVPELVTNIWPGFPTDLMSVAIVLTTQCSGLTLCHDWMYESRMFFTDKLISMGAQINLADPHRVIVAGPAKLKGRQLETPDIRAGMALVLAALIARGTSTINQSELIERGYENAVEKLRSLGAEIERVV